MTASRSSRSEATLLIKKWSILEGSLAILRGSHRHLAALFEVRTGIKVVGHPTRRVERKSGLSVHLVLNQSMLTLVAELFAYLG